MFRGRRRSVVMRGWLGMNNKGVLDEKMNVSRAVKMIGEAIKGIGEIRKKHYERKREELKDIYEKLVCITDLYPNSSPNNILGEIEYAPYYRLEHFDSVLKILDYQIEDYKEQLNIDNFTYERKNNIDMQILNREYAKEKIIEIKKEYQNAKAKYEKFCKLNKGKIELWAGQNVKNCLVEFEVIIHNVFVVGLNPGEDEPVNNLIERAKYKLIGSMRKDMGSI